MKKEKNKEKQDVNNKKQFEDKFYYFETDDLIKILKREKFIPEKGSHMDAILFANKKMISA